MVSESKSKRMELGKIIDTRLADDFWVMFQTCGFDVRVLCHSFRRGRDLTHLMVILCGFCLVSFWEFIGLGNASWLVK